MISKLYQPFLQSSGVSIDSRTIEKDQMFIAIKGDNFDGNQYVQQALEAGAAYVVTSDQEWKDHPKAILVADGLQSLQQLATHHRKQLGMPVIALTGSNGKTTTKELICAVLDTEFKITGTQGNYNNHIGVPLTLLSFTKQTEVGIVEMGANHPREIAALSEIAQPDFGLITNYGMAHLEGFGGVEGVKTSKSELYDYLREHDKTAIIGRWDPEQIVRSSGMKTIFTPESAQLHTQEGLLSFTVDGVHIKTQLTGKYNYHNAVFAYTVGKLMGLEPEQIKKGIESYTPQNNRSQIIKKDNTTILMDAYNANPSSMQVALESLQQQDYKYKVAILGDMFELGAYAKEEHQRIAQLADELKIDEVHLIGKNFKEVGGQYESYETFAQSFDWNPDKEQVILIKGSRGMSLERLLKKWQV